MSESPVVRAAANALDSRPSQRHTADMRKRVQIALPVVVAVLAVTIAWLAFQGARERQPVSSGKRLTVWLRTYAPSSASRLHSREWNEADDAVRHMGTNCIPILLRMIRQKDPQVKLWLVAFVQKHGLTKRFHFQPAAERNVRGVKGLYRFRQYG